jgi:hypothetical protein
MSSNSSAPPPLQQGEQLHLFPPEQYSPRQRARAVEGGDQLQPNWVSLTFLVALTIATIVGTTIWALAILNILHTSWAGVVGAILSALGILLALWPLDSQALRKGKVYDAGSATPRYRSPGKTSLWARKNRGALHVAVGKRLRHTTIALYRGFHQAHRQPMAAASVSEQLLEGEIVYIATFPSVEAGNYTIATQNRECIAIVTVYAGVPTRVTLR